MCNSETLPGVFSIIKRIMILIQIIVPILLIVFASISLIKLLKNPDEKNGTKKIINQFIAAVLVFFIPILVDAVMNLAGDNNEISSCWNSASERIILSNNYVENEKEKDRKKITYDVEKYEKGKSSHWEINNNQYIYHYLDGTTKEWTISEYDSWMKLMEQNVKAMDPKAYTIKGKGFTYAGVYHKQYYVGDEKANNIAIENGVSPYAITVDIDRKHETVFKNNNGEWEPYKNTKVNIGEPWKNVFGKNPDSEIYSKKTSTPIGLYYLDGNRYLYGSSETPTYWVQFGVKYKTGGGHGWNNGDYLHKTAASSLGHECTQGCVTTFVDYAKWIYENCGRGTPVLIW